MSHLVVNQTPFSQSVHSGYNEYYLHVFSRGLSISDEQFLALHLKAVSMCQVILSKVTKKCQATREYFTTELYILLTFHVIHSKWIGCLTICLNFGRDSVMETQKDTCKFTPQPPMMCPESSTYLQFTLPVSFQRKCLNVNVLYSPSIMNPCLQFSFPI